jgi:hypothetical protein
MKKFSTLLLLVLLSLLAVSIAGAQEEEEEDASDELAQIRIAHFVPDGPNVDVYIDGEISAVQDAPYGAVTGWYQVAPGSYSVSIVPEGDDVDNAVIEGVVDVDADSWYTVAAIGLVVQETLDVTVIEEDYSDLSFGETRISAFHAIPDLLPVDVLANGDVLFGLLAYPGSLETAEGEPVDGFASVTLAETTADVQIVDNEDNSVVLVDIGEFTFSQQRNYFIAATGVAADPTFRLVSTNVETVEEEFLGDITAPPSANEDSGFVRVAHLSSGTPAVDVYLDGALTDIQSLEFSSVTEFIELPVGTYDIAVSAEGAGIENAVLEFPLDVIGGQYQTAVAYGILANDTLEATVVEEDFSPTDTGLFRVSVFHAFQDLGPVDLIRDDGLDAIRFLAYPGANEGSDGFDTVDLLAGNYGFTVVLSEDTDTVIAEIPAIEYAADQNVFIGVIESDSGFTLVQADIPGMDE